MRSFSSNSGRKCAQSLRIYWDFRMPWRNWNEMQKEKLGSCSVSGQWKLPLLVWNPARDAGKGKEGSKGQVKISQFYCNVRVLLRKWIQSI